MRQRKGGGREGGEGGGGRRGVVTEDDAVDVQDAVLSTSTQRGGEEEAEGAEVAVRAIASRHFSSCGSHAPC